MKKLLVVVLIVNAALLAGRFWQELPANAQERAGDPAACREDRSLHSADGNNDGAVDISDAVYLLQWLFLGGPDPQVCLAEPIGLQERVATLESSVAMLQGKITLSDLQNCTSGQVPKWSGSQWVCRADNEGAGGSDLTEEQQRILGHMSIVQLENGQGGRAETIRLSGVNLQIVNGLGATNGRPSDPANDIVVTTNGAGNLIVGYQESRGDPDDPDDRTGSHNIVVGNRQNYSSIGGLLAGRINTVAAAYSAVTGGRWNRTGAVYSSVSGGHFNVADGLGAAVSGGKRNSASGENASISGGEANEAGGFAASVSGGQSNRAVSHMTWVGGGRENIAGDPADPTRGVFSSVGGGRNNNTRGDYSSVSGGGADDPAKGNIAAGEYSSISGGARNVAGDRDNLEDQSVGIQASVAGGLFNTASGSVSCVTGGHLNLAGDFAASVSGGVENRALGNRSTVTGGFRNTAAGDQSSVTGGKCNLAGGPWSSVTGGGADGCEPANDDYGFGNKAYGSWSSISGGTNNQVGDPAAPSLGRFGSISGGTSNDVTGDRSSVSGGREITVTGDSNTGTGVLQIGSE